MLGGKHNIIRHTCVPDEIFSEICKEDPEGKYKNKESCVNDCENYYIKKKLSNSFIHKETILFAGLIKEFIQNGLKVYVKGGNALGLCVAQLLYQKYPDKNDFAFHFKDFLNLKLIRDWDFTTYYGDIITPDHRNDILKIGAKYHLVCRASTFILLQRKKPILLDDMALFEISVLEKETLSTMEMPLTTMKIPITPYNLKYIFMFANSFLNKDDIDIDLIIRMLRRININIKTYQNGLFLVTDKNYDRGNLSDSMINFIRDFVKGNRNMEQFLITHTIELSRIFFRLYSKNIPKSDKIKEFLCEKKIKTPNWLLNTKSLKDTIDKYLRSLSAKLCTIYDTYKSVSIEKALDEINKFLEGVVLAKVKFELERTEKEGKKAIEKLFGPLFDRLGKANVDNYGNYSGKILKIQDILKFLADEKII
jgi:hypothetical protein